jgi:two-component system response regulator AtoC
MTKILLVEDGEIMRITVGDRLEKEGWKVDTAINGHAALEKAEHFTYNLVLSDIRMQGLDGMSLLKQIRQLSPDTDVFMMTAYGSVKSRVACLKAGAVDYILKPFEMDDLIIRINRIIEMQSVKARCASLEDCHRQSHQEIIGNSAAIYKVHQLIQRVAPTDSTILINGESGTGKELAATAIYLAGDRADQPYIRVNCAAIPEGLIESELFGHEKGAFTGAHARRLGRFEMADGGTLLLDEIGDMPLPIQAKILRILQEGECERVGGTRTINLDVRLLCATAKDLKKEVKMGRFRQDLLYRISVIPLTMPPLRDRKEDISLLIDHFIEEFSIKRGTPLSLSPEAMITMFNYDFPGNVRELKNIIERASVLAQKCIITPADLPSDMEKNYSEKKNRPVSLSTALARTEKQCILNALTAAKGNRKKSADLLGISRKNLWEKMKLHNIDMNVRHKPA